ncbi:acyl-CoA thioesterase [Planctobacterium marinum]|uniref:acyl-CoA thioesterase n=1 Tax=Planctobacterium marinum TaxID=1631968 RepID=UPI001E29FE8D|nr:acyl-CoA thioesterase II [Planctobacterium marinum]MCC2603951.1 acyl-CoA thioesterase II [Planctobacterium marinum]
MSKLPKINELLSPDKIEEDFFLFPSWDLGFRALYGGQVMAQALSAAQQTVEAPFVVHSLHCYFLLPGDAKLPVFCQVERVRDGRSFATRRVKAIQKGNIIFDCMCSFQLPENGFNHQTPKMPKVPGPESLNNDIEKYESPSMQVSEKLKTAIPFHKPIEIRSVKSDEDSAQQFVWMRLREHSEVEDKLPFHQRALCYASDYYFLMSAVRKHGLSPSDSNLRLATIDHAIWFHRGFDFNDWVLYVSESPTSASGRAYVRGQLFSSNGDLIASTTQEGLLRLKQETKK